MVTVVIMVTMASSEKHEAHHIEYKRKNNNDHHGSSAQDQAHHIDQRQSEQEWSQWQLGAAPSTPHRPDLEEGDKRPILKADMHCERRQASNLAEGWPLLLDQRCSGSNIDPPTNDAAITKKLIPTHEEDFLPCF